LELNCITSMNCSSHTQTYNKYDSRARFIKDTVGRFCTRIIQLTIEGLPFDTRLQIDFKKGFLCTCIIYYYDKNFERYRNDINWFLFEVFSLCPIGLCRATV
jgi:hypothetical protein